MTTILILKNGNCDSDIKDVIYDIDNKINVEILHSSRMTEVKCYESIEKYAGIIILGGHQSLTRRFNSDYPYPYINKLVDYTKIWIENDVHVLGICLGAQIIAEAIGSRTRRLGYTESGYHKNIVLNTEIGEDSLIRPNLVDGLNYVLSHHNDYIDLDQKNGTTNPKPTVVATITNDDGMTIPYVFKVKNCYGLQFHPEVSINILKILCDAFFTFDKQLIDFAKDNIDQIKETSSILFSNWLNFINEKK